MIVQAQQTYMYSLNLHNCTPGYLNSLTPVPAGELNVLSHTLFFRDPIFEVSLSKSHIYEFAVNFQHCVINHLLLFCVYLFDGNNKGRHSWTYLFSG